MKKIMEILKFTNGLVKRRHRGCMALSCMAEAVFAVLVLYVANEFLLVFGGLTSSSEATEISDTYQKLYLYVAVLIVSFFVQIFSQYFSKMYQKRLLLAIKQAVYGKLALPDKYTFLNYVRCHDDIGWGLDYDFLRCYGMEEVPHKKFLNDYFTGKFPGSTAAGELYNDDPVSGDARLCGICASLCGIESALENGCSVDDERPKEAIRKHIMLHAFILTLPGMPMLYSGDEVGQLNDYSYKEMSDKCADSRYVHRGSFNWDQAERREDASSVQGMIFSELKRLEELRSSLPEFCKCTGVMTVDYPDPHIIWIIRESEEGELHAVFNFGDEERKVRISEKKEVELRSWDFVWHVLSLSQDVGLPIREANFPWAGSPLLDKFPQI